MLASSDTVSIVAVCVTTLVSTLMANVLLTMLAAEKALPVADCSASWKVWLPSASALLGRKLQLVPLTVALPSKVEPS